MAVFGIDLGTTYSSVAYLDATGRPSVVPSREGGDSTPSAVYFSTADSVVVGTKAKDTAVLEPDLVVDLIKRELGRHLTLTMHGQQFTAEEVSALILRRLVADAVQATGEQVTEAVITVPAYFGVAERAATQRAGELAGLRVIDVLSEPVAAALSYRVADTGGDRAILVYDLGGGTFDTTVVTVSARGLHEVSTGGDTELGGVDFDERLAEYVIDAFRAEHPDVSHPFDSPATVQDIRARVEEAKRRLSDQDEHTIRVMHDGRVTTVPVTRSRFEQLTADLLDRTIELTRSVLRAAAERGVPRVDEVLLVGGSSRMPAVAARVSAEFGQEPRLHDPDLAVARGAAWYAFEETYRRLAASGEVREANRMASQSGLSAEAEERMATRRVGRVCARGYALGARPGSRLPQTQPAAQLVAANTALPVSAAHPLASTTDNATQLDFSLLEETGRAGRTESAHAPAGYRVIGAGAIRLPPEAPADWTATLTLELSGSGVPTLTATGPDQAPVELALNLIGQGVGPVARARERLAAIRVG
ncbi:MAG: Hsp70 family protein [Actinocatenispora sp.]